MSQRDADPGTHLAPKKTIPAAMAAAKASGRDQIYVADGTYTGQVVAEGVVRVEF